MRFGQMKEVRPNKRELVFSPATTENLLLFSQNRESGLPDPGVFPVVYQDESERKKLLKGYQRDYKNQGEWIFEIKRMSKPREFIDFYQVVSQFVGLAKYKRTRSLEALDEVYAEALENKDPIFVRKVAESTDSKVFLKAFTKSQLKLQETIYYKKQFSFLEYLMAKKSTGTFAPEVLIYIHMPPEQ